MDGSVSSDCSPDFGSQKREPCSKKSEWLLVNPYLIAGIVGASFCFSWFFSVLLTSDFLYSQAGNTQLFQVLHIVFAAVLLLSYLLIWLFSRVLQRHRGVLVVAALACGVAASIPEELIPLSQQVFIFIKAVCVGVGIASLMTLWIEFLCTQLGGQVRVAVASMLVLSFFWYGGVLLVNPRFAPFVVLAFVVFSGGIYVFLRCRFASMGDMPDIDAKESDSRLQITWKPSLLTVMGSVAQGFALYWLLQAEGHTPFDAFLLEGMSLVVVVLLLIDSLGSFVFKESFIRKLFLPVLAACILMLLFIPSEWRLVPCLLAFGFSLLPYTSAIFATCEHIVRCRLSAIRAFAWARLYAVFGLLVGLSAGWIAYSSKVFGDVTLQVVIVIIVMFFILVSTTLSTKSYYPGEDEDCAKEERKHACGEATSDGDARVVDEREFFQLKCDEVASVYGLTNRQTEVLHLLARGRNAAYIQKQLVVSQHTAKAHIYSIYKKTDTHSQQDLMDLVESYRLDGR